MIIVSQKTNIQQIMTFRKLRQCAQESLFTMLPIARLRAEGLWFEMERAHESHHQRLTLRAKLMSTTLQDPGDVKVSRKKEHIYEVWSDLRDCGHVIHVFGCGNNHRNLPVTNNNNNKTMQVYRHVSQCHVTAVAMVLEL